MPTELPRRKRLFNLSFLNQRALTKLPPLSYNETEPWGRHPSQKTAGDTARGRIPIEKNVIVVDASGKTYESTWLKRANGLVKKGRARWLDERTICLACPPELTEDTTMEENKVQESLENGWSLEKLLERMDVIRKDMQDLTQTIHIVEGLPESPDSMVKAETIGSMFKERETTLQQQLRFLERIYSDHFSVRSEADKTPRMEMLLSKMNDVIACLGSGDGKTDALNAVMMFYNDLLKQA